MSPYTFVFLQYCGLWQPIEWQPGWKRVFYKSYSIFVNFIMYTDTLSELIALILSIDHFAETANNTCILISMIGVCGKSFNILVKRELIANMEITLQTDPCRPCNHEEKSIQEKFNKRINTTTFAYIGLIEATVTFVTAATIIRDVPYRILSYNAWFPYNHSTPIGFWTASMHQTVAHYYGASINGASDTLMPAMMMQICAQFAILSRRFQVLPALIQSSGSVRRDNRAQELMKFESKKLGEIVEHHLQIIQWAQRCNEIFSAVIILQYIISSIVLCISVCALSQMEVYSPSFASIFMYLISMLLQIFLLCYTGNQVTLESSNVCQAIYEMDWTYLSITTKKSLVMIMGRTMHPIQITGGPLITLSIDSFNNLVKFSYSAFNVLQRTSGT